MVAVERLRKIIDCILVTEQLPDATPVSASLLSGSDAGKSQLILERIPSTARIVNDFHFAALIPMLASEHPPTRIIVPDFNMVLSHRPTVATLTCAMLLGLMGEGIDEIPGLDGKDAKLRVKELKDRGISLSLLTAMTADMFRSKRGKWRGTGFLRRMLPIHYAYSAITVEKIQDHINGGNIKADYTKHIFTPPKKRWIKVRADYLNAIKIGAESARRDQLIWFWKDREKGTATPVQAIDYPFTIQKTYIAMVKAHALLNDHGEVESSDMDFLFDMHKFVRYDHPELI